jgi:enoyl-CoA hydratase/carnithine racemase
MIRFTIEGQVGTVTLARAPVNAIDPVFVSAFHAALDEALQAGPTVLIVRSTQKVFCAGADLSLIAGFFDAQDGVAQMDDYVRALHALFDRIETFPAVTLAVIDGAALGGGLELALACDLRVAATRAQIGLPEARVGMIPGAGGTQRLTRLCGPGVSARLILGGEVVDGTEAARLGIVQWAVGADALGARADDIAARIAGLSRQALLASKDCIAAWSDPEIDGFAREIEKPRALIPTQEARERVLGFFRRKDG